MNLLIKNILVSYIKKVIKMRNDMNVAECVSVTKYSLMNTIEMIEAHVSLCKSNVHWTIIFFCKYSYLQTAILIEIDTNRIKPENNDISFLWVDMHNINKEIKDVRNSQY